jgi:hypothetical protein
MVKIKYGRKMYRGSESWIHKRNNEKGGLTSIGASYHNKNPRAKATRKKDPTYENFP